MLSHGLGSSRYKITVDLSEESLMEDVKETEDNTIIFDQLREAYTVLETKHIDQLNDWINALIKIDIQNKAEKQKLVETLINFKSRADEEARKAKLLGIEISHRGTTTTTTHPGLQNIDDEEEDEFDDELFEQVDVPDTNIDKNDENIPINSSKLPPLQRIFPLSFEPSMIEDATYAGPKIIDKE